MICGQSFVRSLLCVFFTSVLLNNCYSQTLPLDPSFNNTGYTISKLPTASVANAVVVQPDEKIIVGGTGLVRYNSSGTIDSSFNDTGVVTPPFLIRSVALQTDGKIVAAGVRGDSVFVVGRYTNTGRPDSTFGTNGVVVTSFDKRSVAYSVVIQSDGKIIAGGGVVYDPTYAGRSNLALVRYHSNGSIDSTYGVNGKVILPLFHENNTQLSIYAASIALRPDNKIYVAINETLQFRVGRFKTDGSLDSTFGAGGLVKFPIITTNNPSHANSIALQKDGKIVLAGTTTTNGSRWPVFAVARLDSTGALDLTFNQTGKINSRLYYDDYGKSVAIQDDGKIVVAGYGVSIRGRLLVAQYDEKGVWIAMNSFELPNTSWGGIIGSAVGTSRSRVYVVGSSDQYLNQNQSASRSEMTTVAFFPASILPLHLVEFKATLAGAIVSCSWQTEHEINTAHFNVQRSNDGQNFSTIGQVAATGNAPTAAYTYADASFGQACNNCTYYYRLQMVDKDGKFTYSKVIPIKWQSSSLATVFPNPARSVLFINRSTADMLEIFSTTGLVVHRQKISAPVTQINIAGYAKGAYFIRLSDSKGNFQVEKVVVE